MEREKMTNYSEYRLANYQDDNDAEIIAEDCAIRGLARELIPSDVLADEWYQRGQPDMETLLERI